MLPGIDSGNSIVNSGNRLSKGNLFIIQFRESIAGIENQFRELKTNSRNRLRASNANRGNRQRWPVGEIPTICQKSSRREIQPYPGALLEGSQNQSVRPRESHADCGSCYWRFSEPCATRVLRTLRSSSENPTGEILRALGSTLSWNPCCLDP